MGTMATQNTPSALREQAHTLEMEAKKREDERHAAAEIARDNRIERVQRAEAHAKRRTAIASYLAKNSATPEIMRYDFGRLIRGEAPVSDDFRAVMTPVDNNLGGYLVPTQVIEAFHVEEDEWGVARRYAFPRTVNVHTTLLPTIQPNRSFYDTGLNADLTIPDSSFTVGSTPFVLRTIAITIPATTDLSTSSDWVSVAMRELANAARELEDRMTFMQTATGLGSGGLAEILLMPERAGSLAVCGTGETSLAGVTAASIRAAVAKLPSRGFIGARWFLNPAAADMVLRLSGGAAIEDGDAEASIPFEIDGGEWVFAGLPVTWTSALPASPGAGDLFGCVGNLRRAVQLATTGDFQIRFSNQAPEVALKDQVLARLTWRGDVGFPDLGSATKAGSLVGLRLAEG
jgi:HK97 family phage major capsid protein